MIQPSPIAILRILLFLLLSFPNLALNVASSTCAARSLEFVSHLTLGAFDLHKSWHDSGLTPATRKRAIWTGVPSRRSALVSRVVQGAMCPRVQLSSVRADHVESGGPATGPACVRAAILVSCVVHSLEFLGASTSLQLAPPVLFLESLLRRLPLDFARLTALRNTVSRLLHNHTRR
ncbi:hypothetical protein B0H12DRAFT_1075959 [Mycena haematopus]|nr:hypothetical protein B0H12DRAFT_1075959 [Mycena haematopus]